MKNKITRDYSISLIRIITTTFIIICHFFQYLNIELAWWFNVGVQMFLCMSGFLYGQRGLIKDELNFYKKNIIKIIIDYYVVIFFVILLFIIFIPEKISITLIIKVLLTNSTLYGGGHLWYIPYCLFCYLITPFLSRYFDNYKNNNIVKHFIFLCIIIFVMIEAFFNYFNPVWIVCYILGFFLGYISTNKKSKLYNNISLIIVFLAILFNSIQIIQDYFIKFELNGIIDSIYLKFCNFAHVMLGVAIFVALKFIFSRLFKTNYSDNIKSFCLYSDKYSYDIYLVHQFFILGPFSLMNFTEILGINIVIILILIGISAVTVNLISNFIRKKLQYIIKIQ